MGDLGELSDQFIQNAIAPILIALAMTIGWIMLRGIQSLTGLEDGGGTMGLQATPGTPIMGLTTLQDLMVAVGTVAVVWLGVFSAASKTIAAPVTDAIKGGIQTAATWVGQLPLKHAPIFPIKVPNEDEPFNATFSQISQTVKDMTEESYDDKRELSLKINPQSNAAKNSLSDITDGKGMKSWYNQYRNKKPKEMHILLKDLTPAKFAKITTSLRGETNGHELIEELTSMRKGEGDLEKIHDSIRSLVKGSPSLKAQVPSDENTPAAEGAAVSSVVPDTAQVNGKAFKALEEGQQEQIVNAHNIIKRETEKDIEKIDVVKVTTAVELLKKENVKASELESIIGKDALTQLKQAFPGKFDTNDQIQKVLNGNVELKSPASAADDAPADDASTT